MLKKLMLTTAIGALMIGGAMAQTTAPRRRRACRFGAVRRAVTQQKPDQ